MIKTNYLDFSNKQQATSVIMSATDNPEETPKKEDRLTVGYLTKPATFSLLQDPSFASRTPGFFIEEVIFRVPGSLRIHPSLWSKEDVIQWLRWAEEEYSLRRTDDSKFIMNGRGLCVLTKEDFKKRSPSSGDVLYELLTCIKSHRRAFRSHPFIKQSIRKINHHQLDTSPNKTTVIPRSYVACCSYEQTSIMDRKLYQDGPLNLSYRTQREYDKKD
ncbi:transcription factor ETV6-like [Spea bombifrons]|uniref:transcription factor ETV6-like n=1 Tax=Spea bombifrons TaxID=233779 RepID=UPI00234AF057|nr:transcription factor ETV6-like [Spea bombifrons]